MIRELQDKSVGKYPNENTEAKRESSSKESLRDTWEIVSTIQLKNAQTFDHVTKVDI